MSTGGNVLLTIVADTCGRHDTLGGACANESNMVRYAIEKRFMHACRSSFLKAVTEWDHGMTKRDITCNINFFMNVPVTPEGGLTFEDGISEPGKYVEMRAEMDVLALISNCPQLNNPCNAYNPTPVQVLIWTRNVPQGPHRESRRHCLPHCADLTKNGCGLRGRVFGARPPFAARARRRMKPLHRPRPLRKAISPSPRCSMPPAAPARKPSIRATASSARMPTSPKPAPLPASSSSDRRPRRCAPSA